MRVRRMFSELKNKQTVDGSARVFNLEAITDAFLMFLAELFNNYRYNPLNPIPSLHSSLHVDVCLFFSGNTCSQLTCTSS